MRTWSVLFALAVACPAFQSAHAQARPAAARSAAPGVTWQSVSAADGFTCAVTTAGAVYCWGTSTFGAGQLGVPGIDSSRAPTRVTPDAGYTYTRVETGGSAACATTAEQALVCWGRGIARALAGRDQQAPTLISGPVALREVSLGYAHCGLTQEGTAYCWGSNGVGQVGNGTTAEAPTPSPVWGGLRFRALAAGGATVCAIDDNGAAWCWGSNSGGALGDGGQRESHVPVRVAGGLTFTSLAVGHAFACGITTDSLAYCWGEGGEGQLGSGQRSSVRTPQPVAGGLVFTAIAAGYYHTCGVTSTGAAYCWGKAEPGLLGTGALRASATPVAVVGGLAFRAITVSYAHACGLTTDGAIYCWGDNSELQLGTRISVTCRELVAPGQYDVRRCNMRPTRVMDPR